VPLVLLHRFRGNLGTTPNTIAAIARGAVAFLDALRSTTRCSLRTATATR
jgi:hypothetical protein